MAPGATIVGCCLALGLGTGAAAQSTQGDAAQLMNAAFAPGRTDRAFSSIDHILDSATRAGPGRAYGWTTGQVQLAGGIPNNAVRVSVGGTVAPLNGLISGPQQTRFDPKAYEIAVTRDWPDAVSFSTDRYDVKLTPTPGSVSLTRAVRPRRARS